MWKSTMNGGANNREAMRHLKKKKKNQHWRIFLNENTPKNFHI